MTDQEYFYKCLTLRDDTAPITRHDGGKNYLISVFPDPLKVPCFHLTRKGSWEVVLSITDWTVLRTMNKRFTVGKRLPRALEKEIISYLAEEMHSTKISKWAWLVRAWDMENPGRTLKGDPDRYEMPR